jgi:hypothetical protein
MRGAFASKAGAASRGIGSGSGTLAASLLKIRTGSCVRCDVARAAVPAQPALAAAKTATNNRARS